MRRNPYRQRHTAIAPEATALPPYHAQLKLAAFSTARRQPCRGAPICAPYESERMGFS